MSLLERMAVPCCLMVNRQVPDGAGGFTNTWSDSTQFKAVIVRDSSIVAKIAERESETEQYTVTVSRNMTLSFHDVIRRTEDSKTFRITSTTLEKMSPAGCGLDMAQCTAEAWEVPRND